MLAIPFFLLGAVFGSFATALAHRLPRSENWWSDRSRCPACNHQIRARDNVPIISWLVLRGRCHSCGERISARYPLTEAGLGALFTLLYLVASAQDWSCMHLVLGLALCAFLAIITLTDLDLRIIPNPIVIAGTIAGIAIVVLGDLGDIPARAIAAGAGGGLLALVALAYPRGMGMGDAKLVGMMGIYLGKALAPGVLIGFAAGALVGVVMIARHGAAARKQAIPFGPFLALGGVIALLVGDQIVDWYTDSFFSGS